MVAEYSRQKMRNSLATCIKFVRCNMLVSASSPPTVIFLMDN